MSAERPPGKLGIVVHLYNTAVDELAKQAIEWASGVIDVCLPSRDALKVGRGDLGVPEEEFGPQLAACLSLGGDGTMLRTTALVAAHGVDILGVNGGHLGYLTEVDPEHMVEALQQWHDGRFRTEQRMMIDVFEADGTTPIGTALNEAVIERSEPGRAVEVTITISGQRFITVLADGLIVATPTGSTAYSLSAGGPIVEPSFEALILTPVAAHGVFNRPMVLSPGADVELRVEGHRPAAVTMDGRPWETAEGVRRHLAPGEAIHCRTSPVGVKLLVRGDRDFHLVLKEKFGLSDR